MTALRNSYGVRAMEMHEEFSALMEKCRSERNLTFEQIAKLAKTSYNTLYRISSGKQVPRLQTLLDYLEILCRTNEEVRDFIARHRPEDLPYLVHLGSPGASETGKGLQGYDMSPLVLEIAAFAARPGGVTESEILHKFGERSAPTIELLNKRGVFSRVDGKRYEAEKFVISNTDAIRQAVYHAGDLNRDRTRKMRCSLEITSLNQEGKQALRKRLVEFIKDVNDIRTDSRYSGNMPAIISALALIEDEPTPEEEQDNE